MRLRRLDDDDASSRNSFSALPNRQLTQQSKNWKLIANSHGSFSSSSELNWLPQTSNDDEKCARKKRKTFFAVWPKESKKFVIIFCCPQSFPFNFFTHRLTVCSWNLEFVDFLLGIYFECEINHRLMRVQTNLKISIHKGEISTFLNRIIYDMPNGERQQQIQAQKREQEIFINY